MHHIYSTAPTYLCDLISFSSTRCLRSTTSGAAAVQSHTYTRLGDRAFSIAGPRVWNNLPASLRQIVSATAFKRQLKTYLFSCAFYSDCLRFYLHVFYCCNAQQSSVSLYAAHYKSVIWFDLIWFDLRKYYFTNRQRRIYGFWCPGQDLQTMPPPLSDGPSDDGFQLTLSVSKFTYLINAFCSPPLWCPLPWCPGQLPQSPTPRSTTANRVVNAWNSLPDHVVTGVSETINTFKSWLDKLWQHQDMIYDPVAFMILEDSTYITHF